jgi:hypothetical protein
VSSASRASNLGAVDKGLPVWISNAKHASFLVQRQCALGCGGDRCENVIELKSRQIVNLGEAGAPLNGAIWANSKNWNLAAKMVADFDDRVLARLANSEAGEIIRLRERPPSAQAVIRSGGSTLDSIEGSGRRTDQAIEKSSASVDGSLSRAAGAVAKSVRSSLGSAAQFLRLKQK